MNIIEILEGREFWLYFTYSILGFGVALLYWGDLGGWQMRSSYKWERILGALVYGFLHVCLFRYVVEKEWMLWLEFSLYIAPVVLISIVASLTIRDSAEFVITIPGYTVLWLVVRWWYGTIPDE
jgi:hypothetical protein